MQADLQQLHKPIQIIGVPLDLGASRRGTDAGPSALRIEGLGSCLQKLGYEVLLETDIPVPAMETRLNKKNGSFFKPEILEVCSQLAETTFNALASGALPLVIGGDHSIAMGTVSGVSSFYKEKQQDIGLIWFDAHGDMNIPETSPSGNIHGMPLAHLLGYGDKQLTKIMGPHRKINPENAVLVGIRDIDNRERELIHQAGIQTFTMRDIDEQGMASISKQAIQIATRNTTGFHLSFDVDVCDPTVIPGSGTLVPGGVSFREAHLLMEHCADSRRMISMEVAELNPFLDQNNVSANRTAALIQSAFGRSIL